MDPATVGVASGKIIETLIVNYGPPGLIIAALCLVIWRIFNLYLAQVEKTNNQTVGYIESINKNTTALDSLKELVKARGGDK